MSMGDKSDDSSVVEISETFSSALYIVVIPVVKNVHLYNNIIQHLIQQNVHITINNRMLFCDGPHNKKIHNRITSVYLRLHVQSCAPCQTLQSIYCTVCG
jgi:hypothetical protein